MMEEGIRYICRYNDSGQRISLKGMTLQPILGMLASMSLVRVELRLLF